MSKPVIKHFTRAEFSWSKTATENKIENIPPRHLLGALELTMMGAERIRAVLRAPMHITSGYRCGALNRLVGGAENSQHTKCEAFDFVCPDFGTPRQIFETLAPKIRILAIDQLILEHDSKGRTWVHVSFTPNPRYNALIYVGGVFAEYKY
jgi:zinc D-Ala-D-Ala carboxypeptidase